MKIKYIVLIIVCALTLTACGKKGEPVAPSSQQSNNGEITAKNV